MNTPPFKNKKGELTLYGLACGYVQEFEQNKVRLIMEKDGCYHVKVFDHNNMVRITWESCNKLAEARRWFNYWRKRIKVGQISPVPGGSLRHPADLDLKGDYYNNNSPPPLRQVRRNP
jgi:hypothetical protein